METIQPSIELNEKNTRRVGFLFVAGYILLRMVADPLVWRYVSEYWSYAFEIAFVLLAYFYFRTKISLWSFGRGDALALLASSCAGAAVYLAASPLGAAIPFDLSSVQTVFLLLAVGPVLEELIFRMALWEAFAAFLKAPAAVLVATTLLFAAGHLAAYWFVPEQFKSFVLYQTFYVLVLGFAAGWRKWKSGAVSSAVFVHFGFNLGFLIASKLQ
jgi:membrane protease YdiL (CAAX protease family)